MTASEIEARVSELVARKLAEADTAKQNRPRRLALIASKGSLDWAYPPFILASTAGAMGWEVCVFFTFYGLPLLLKELQPEVTPLGNPAMPMKMPFGPEGFQKFDWPIPTALMVLPGFNALATTMMRQTFKNKGVATVRELRGMCVEAGVQMIACQMTMDVFGYQKADFIEECSVGGAASFLDYASQADVSLFV